MAGMQLLSSRLKHQTDITYSIASGSEFPLGTTQVSFTATDKGNNTSNCTFNVMVNSSTPPVITCPTDIIIANDPNVCTAMVNFNVSGSDNCAVTSLTQDEGLSSGSDFPVGTTLNTFTATNTYSLTASCSFNVIVTDNTPPVANCQDQTITLDANGNASIEVSEIDNGSSDNCAIANQTLDFTSFTCGNVGDNTITQTVTDINGNSSTCQATVTVEDNIGPGGTVSGFHPSARC